MHIRYMFQANWGLLFQLIVNNMRVAIFSIMWLVCFTCRAQNVYDDKVRLQKEIDNFFWEDKGIFDRVEDCGRLYTYFFQIDVLKNIDRSVTVSRIFASDSIAYTHYPNYLSLKKFDFGVFMNGRDKASFILPVALEVVSSKGEQYLQRKEADGLDLILNLFPRTADLEGFIYFRPVAFRINKQVLN